MKKRYKLIKMYPSLPKDWEIGMIVGLGDRTWGYSPESLKYDYFELLSNLEVETNPEFWKEIKYLFTTTDGVYIYEGEQSVLVDKETLEIKKLDYNIGNNFSMFYYFSTTKAAEKFVKEQKILLVTNDGYNLYEGDLYYNVYFKNYDNLFSIQGPWKVEVFDSDTKWSEHSVFFFKKENAEKYIEENKPKYSYLDLVRYFNLISGYNPEMLDLFNFKDFFAVLESELKKEKQNGLGN